MIYQQSLVNQTADFESCRFIQRGLRNQVETFKDIWASMVESTKERTTNPLTAAFLLSWATWNYKFFVVLTGDGTTSERLASIKSMYPSGELSTYGGALLYPLNTALLYVFVYPYLSQWVIRFYRSRQVAIANTIKEVERIRVLTHEEAAALTRRHEVARTKWDAKEKFLNLENSQLRDALLSAERQLEDLVAKSKDTSVAPIVAAETPEIMSISEKKAEEEDEEEEDKADLAIKTKYDTISIPANLSASSMRKLLLLSEVQSGIGAKDLANKLDENYSITLTDLEELGRFGLVKQNGLGRWELTSEGRTIAVSMMNKMKSSKAKASSY